MHNLPAIKSKLRAGKKTIREVFEQILAQGAAEPRYSEAHLDKTKQKLRKERRHQSLNPVHDCRNGKYTYKKIAPTHGTSPALIKLFIASAGYSPDRIVREIGVTRATVSQIINGRGDRSAEVEKFISHITKVKLTELFPSWYSKTDKR